MLPWGEPTGDLVTGLHLASVIIWGLHDGALSDHKQNNHDDENDDDEDDPEDSSGPKTTVVTTTRRGRRPDHYDSQRTSGSILIRNELKNTS